MERESSVSIPPRKIDPIEQITFYSPEQMAWERVVNLPSDLHDFVSERIRLGFYSWQEAIKLPVNKIREHKQRVETGVHEFGHYFAVSILGGINKRITAIPNLAAGYLGVTEFSLAGVGDTASRLKKMIAIAFSGVAGARVGETNTGGGGSDRAQAHQAAGILSQLSGGSVSPEAYINEGQSTANKITGSIGKGRLRFLAHQLQLKEAA